MPAPPPEPPGRSGQSDRLESWKEIAAYLGRGVSTVRRWEREEELPVRRLDHLKRGSVLAFKSEIDRWLQLRTTPLPAEEAPAVVAAAAPPRSRPGILIVTTTVCLLALLVWAIATNRLTPPPALVAVPIVHIGGPAFEGPPDLSPDGATVACSSRAPGITGIYVKPVDGGDARRLTQAPESDEFPQWSPDGSQIVFVRWDRDWRDIMLIPAAGGEPRRLLRRPRTGNYRTKWAAWAADGRHLLIVDSDSAAEPLAIWRLHIATGERTRLTRPPAGSFGDAAACASPDGTWIAFTRWLLADRPDLYLLRVGTGEEKRLTFEGSFVRGAA
jgi:Tol biopolymer transport system component/predicted DNA-binding transcriptional regulator AlpA